MSSVNVLRAARYTIQGWPWIVPGFDAGTVWNGFAAPVFPQDLAAEIITRLADWWDDESTVIEHRTWHPTSRMVTFDGLCWEEVV